MTDKSVTIAGIKLRTDRPTRLTFQELFQWVIWQFPRPEKSGLCGAVRPPLPDHDWIPAIIQVGKKCVFVHAHAGETFPTPELAVEFFNAGNHSKKK
ncbi:MAG: hypothetical protein R3293_08010 [Candidatus Promineifilaceae bacterium]|nr:hypothetical protein [Candidatus Promineifilaceae bacterium]